VLKRRLIPVLYIKNGLIVRSQGFSYHQNIGNVINEAERYDQWCVDELVYIDISREPVYDLRRDDLKVKSLATIAEIVASIGRVCSMPLAFGGGIRRLEDIDLLVRNGADKVVINTAAREDPGLVAAAADKYGSQCVMVSIDYRMVDGRPRVFTRFGAADAGIGVVEWIRECERLGAGEVLINSIDRDGAGKGFDIATAAEAAACTRLPVIACGGAGDDDDFVALARGSTVSGLAAGNFFHFTEHAYPRVKRLLLEEGIDVRPYA
jgi:imidazole glycerol-phosphate synthase subunit HisF